MTGEPLAMPWRRNDLLERRQARSKRIRPSPHAAISQQGRVNIRKKNSAACDFGQSAC